MNIVETYNYNNSKFIFNEYLHHNIQISKAFIKLKMPDFVFTFTIIYDDNTAKTDSFILLGNDFETNWLEKRYEEFIFTRTSLLSPNLIIKTKTNPLPANITQINYKINNSDTIEIFGNVLAIEYNLLGYNYVYLHIEPVYPNHSSYSYGNLDSDKDNCKITLSNEILMSIEPIILTRQIEFNNLLVDCDNKFNQSFYINFKDENENRLDIESTTILFKNYNKF